MFLIFSDVALVAIITLIIIMMFKLEGVSKLSVITTIFLLAITTTVIFSSYFVDKQIKKQIKEKANIASTEDENNGEIVLGSINLNLQDYTIYIDNEPDVAEDVKFVPSLHIGDGYTYVENVAKITLRNNNADGANAVIDYCFHIKAYEVEDIEDGKRITFHLVDDVERTVELQSDGNILINLLNKNIGE